MKIIVQRSKKSSVKVEGNVVGSIDKGLVLLVAFTHGDTIDTLNKYVNKVLNLRIFDDENKVMNKSVLDAGGSILSISQFTLYGNAKKGNRPSYINAMGGSEAVVLYNKFNDMLKESINVETGMFGTDMEVSIINDGPTTIILEDL